MKNVIYQKLNKNNILFLVMLLSVFLLPSNSYANSPAPETFFVDQNRLFGYVSGNSCGDKTCNADEVCQKEYRGVLPIESDSNILGLPKTTTFTCVKARPIQAPASPFRGDTGCAEGISGLSGILGDTVSGLLGQGVLGGLFGGINLVGFGSSLFGGPSAYTFIKPGDIAGSLISSISDPLISQFRGLLGDGGAGFNRLINLNLDGDDECANYNNINTVIDTRRLTAPLPVDIFNPLPLPVNVTSPTPLPVVVVDDLALYQQKELIDAPLAAKQKAQTIATISDTLRETMSREGGTLYNYFFQTLGTGINEGALNTDTGVLPKALEKYGGSATFSPQTISDLTNNWKEKQDPTKISSLPEQNFAEQCGNLEPSQIENISFKCALLALESQNDPNHLKQIINQATSDKVASAEELNKIKILSGDGFLPTVFNGNNNIFTERVTSPGSTKRALTDKVVGASIDQAIIASGTNCFEAIPNNILNASLRPVLTQGMFNVSNPLSATNTTNTDKDTLITGAGTVTTTASGTTLTGTSTTFTKTFQVGDVIMVNGETGQRITAINSDTSLTVSLPFSENAKTNVSYTYYRELANLASNGIAPNPNQLITSLQNTLLQNITNSLSCVFRQQITSLLNGVLGNFNIPGLGNNVTRTITNTVGSTVDRTIREGLNSIIE